MKTHTGQCFFVGGGEAERLELCTRNPTMSSCIDRAVRYLTRNLVRVPGSAESMAGLVGRNLAIAVTVLEHETDWLRGRLVGR